MAQGVVLPLFPHPNVSISYLQGGFADPVAHGLHVALLFFQLLLQLGNPRLQATLLILQCIPKGNAAALGIHRPYPVLGQSPW